MPESMAVFSDLTVKENLVLAARDGALDDTQLDWIFGFFPALRRFWLSRAASLSGESPGCTGTEACAITGPASSSGTTK